jgi:hypothetical protein
LRSRRPGPREDASGLRRPAISGHGVATDIPRSSVPAVTPTVFTPSL